MSSNTGIQTRNVEFAEKPATAEEKVISVVLKKFSEAVNEKNLTLLSTLLDDEAVISVFSSELLDKEAYLKKMERLLPNVRRVKLRNVVIRVQSSTMATVFCDRAIFLKMNLRPRVSVNRSYKVVKRDEVWRITEIH